MNFEFSKRAIKDIAKLEKSVRDAVFDYFESLEKYSMAERLAKSERKKK